MSLGIKLTWRALPFRNGSHRRSLVPRGPCPASITFSTLQQQSSRCKSTGPSNEGDHKLSEAGNEIADGQLTAAEPTPFTRSKQRHSARAATLESVVVQPYIPYPHPRSNLLSLHEHTRSAARQRTLEQRRPGGRVSPPDWRLILDDLKSWTPGRIGSWVPRKVKVLVPRKAAEKLTSGIDESIWDIELRTGCRLELLVVEGSATPSTMFLSGDDTVIIHALDELSRLVGEGTVLINSHEAGNDADTTLSSKLVVTEQNIEDVKTFSSELRLCAWNYKHYTLKARLKDIPAPSEWTKESFHAYVTTLTSARLEDNVVLQREYSSVGGAQSHVIRLLHEAFTNEAARHAVSNAAFRVALAYMIRHGGQKHGLTHAWKLIHRAEQVGVPMTASAFNLLLEAAVQRMDLSSFHRVLRSMLKQNQAPNLKTWILFLRIIQNEEVKRLIVREMHSRGLLGQPRVLRLLALELVVGDTHSALQRGLSTDAFLAEQEEKYGPTWQATDTMNKIIQVFARYGKFDECLALMDGMISNPSSRPDSGTVMATLPHCKEQQAMKPALGVLARAETLTRLELDHQAYEQLFRMGWRMKVPNFMAVVWHYACVNGATSVKMRDMVLNFQRSVQAADRLSPNTSVSAHLAQSLIDQERPELLRECEDGSGLRLATMAAYEGWETVKPLSKMLEMAWGWDRELHRHWKREKGGEPHLEAQKPGDVVIPISRTMEGEAGLAQVVFAKAVYKRPSNV
jgi:pentatricopeptide repeat protein